MKKKMTLDEIVRVPFGARKPLRKKKLKPVTVEAHSTITDNDTFTLAHDEMYGTAGRNYRAKRVDVKEIFKNGSNLLSGTYGLYDYDVWNVYRPVHWHYLPQNEWPDRLKSEFFRKDAIKIGCMVFYGENYQKLRKWALASTKKAKKI